MAKRHGREKMEALLEERDREGLTYRALAERSGVPANTLAAWSYRLRRERSQLSSGAFVELEPAVEAEETAVQVVVNDRVHVLVWSGFDPETLRSVIATLS